MEILVCPVTKEPLELEVEEADGEEILRGALYSRALNFRYPITDGIPNLLPPDMQTVDPR